MRKRGRCNGISSKSNSSKAWWLCLPLLAGAPSVGLAGSEAVEPPAAPAPGLATEAREPTPALENIEIFGERFERYPAEISIRSATAVDSAELLTRTPGAAPASNGALTGQTQYRGMTGVRVNVAVDGMHINAGGPNIMDPPLHYAPRALLESLELQRGIASVSSGMETIGGSVSAKTKTSHFTDGPGFELHGDLDFAHRSNDGSVSAGGILWLANENQRLHFLTLTEKGDDLRVPEGRIEDSAFERKNYGFGYGFRVGEQEFSIDFRQSSTDPSGTPALPLDIRFFDSQLIRAEYKGAIGGFDLSGRAFSTQIDHSMDNFEQRPIAPPAMATRFVTASSDGFGYELAAKHGLGSGTLGFGTDGHIASHDMEIFNPKAPAFFVRNFNDAERKRFGAYTEWKGELGNAWSLEAGLRYNRVTTGTGDVATAPVLPLPAQRLAADFNARDHKKTDHNVDWVLKASREVNSSLTLQAGVARKMRSPFYIERYAWLPIEATAGLADGNNHIGNIDLDPEVSHELELGLEWRSATLFFSPRAFVRYVDDYIQGTPTDSTPGVIDSDLERVSAVNGDPTPLRYSNVDAKLFGVDLAWGWAIASDLALEGTLTWVRGERRDISDDLYRIAPLSGTVALRYDVSDRLAIGLESVFAAEQSHVSETNDEEESSGYGVVNANVSWRFSADASLQLGIENVLDQAYRRHLAGFNRVAGADTALGERFQGPGRGVSIKVAYAF